MLTLPQVTLCCVDTRLPEMALDAMKRSMEKVQFADAVLFTRPDHGLKDVPDGLRVVTLDHITSIEAYSHFLLKEMTPYLHTTHMLIVQWDGYVLDPFMWRDAFLEVDYIGAVWPQYKDAHRVGNGGFSLRSRKLLDALASEDVVPEHPEDVCIARTYRPWLEQRWSIKFADEDMAHHFSFERERKTRSSFGFHGMSNFFAAMPSDQLTDFVDQAPPELFCSTEGRKFIKTATHNGHLAIAEKALAKRQLHFKRTLSEVRLSVRLALKKGIRNMARSLPL